MNGGNLEDMRSRGLTPGDRDSEEFAVAVSVVRKELSEESVKILRYSLDRDDWIDGPIRQANFGIAIRNMLARKGIVWEDAARVCVWFAVLQKALELPLEP